MRTQQLLKAALTVFICFHVTAIFLLPNPESILNRRTHFIFGTYGSFIGFNTTWRFFSPNPLMRLMEYEVFTKDDEGSLVGKTYRYPKVYEEEKYREIYNRKLNNAVFMMTRTDALPSLLGRKLCEWHPEAGDIAIYVRGREFPTIEKSQTFNADNIVNLGQVVKTHLLDIHCLDGKIILGDEDFDGPALEEEKGGVHE